MKAADKWRAGAQRCGHRVFTTEPSGSIRKGNPLCAFTFVGARCTRAICPIRNLVETRGERVGKAGGR